MAFISSTGSLYHIHHDYNHIFKYPMISYHHHIYAIHLHFKQSLGHCTSQNSQNEQPQLGLPTDMSRLKQT